MRNTTVGGLTVPAERYETGSPRLRLGVGLTVGVALLAGGAMIALFAKPSSIDYPVTLFFNRFVNRSGLFEAAMSAITRLNLLKGVFAIAAAWFVWFDNPRPGERAGIAAGLIAASFVGLLSRAWQIVLPIHARPIHDPSLHFVPPHWVDPEKLNHWSAFPSDHASLLFAIVLAIVLIRPAVGMAVFAWSLVVVLARVYSGFHFLSDVIGGLGLAITVGCISQTAPIRRACQVFPRWAAERPAVFYALAFVATFLLASMFDDIRSIGKGMVHMMN